MEIIRSESCFMKWFAFTPGCQQFSFAFSLEEQVLTRFEEENGGQVVVATVCLLETSRHGLLETELLQMLAEETTLTPPPYVEGESDQITVTKAETTQAGLLLLKDSLVLNNKQT